MKTLLKLTAAAAAIALASPAFACGEEKMKAAENKTEKSAVVAKAEKKAAAPAKAQTKTTQATTVATRN